MSEVGIFIKFGKLEHLQKLQNEGLLYMKDLQYFWDVEDEDRGDPFDCIAEVARGPRISFTAPAGKEVFMDGEWIIRMNPPQREKINIFCMYALRPIVGSFPVDMKNFRLGDHALIVLNRAEFMHRIESVLNSQKIIFDANLVEYVDDKYMGKLGPYRKLKKFCYQSEWRLVCYDGPGRTREMRIGSIRDISAIIPSSEVNTEIRVDFEELEKEPESGRP